MDLIPFFPPESQMPMWSLQESFAFAKKILAGAVDLVYPRICLLCKNPLAFTAGKNPVCFVCQNKIHLNRPPFCHKCSRPLEHLRNMYCHTCAKTYYYFDQAWAATIYNDAVRKLIHLFKYGNKTSLRECFFEYLLTFITTYQIPLEEFDLIVPIPLHPTRLRERGYNQSQLIAQMLSREFAIPCVCEQLLRTRNTRNQARLSPKERWTNIHAAFKIKQSQIFKNKNILIVDDLLTTGATLSEAAWVLKECKASRVAALTVAITISPNDD